jgi:uncharacterized protein (TIGR02118 family)
MHMETVNPRTPHPNGNAVIQTFKLIILLNKKENMTDQQFAEYWLAKHAPLAKGMPGLRRYVVNLVQRPPNREPEYSGIAELWFDDKESMKASFASPEGEATEKDTEKFTSKRTTLYVEQHTITGISKPKSSERSPIARRTDARSPRNVDL